MFFSKKFPKCARRVYGYCQHTGEGTKAESVDKDKRKHERWHCAHEFKNASDKGIQRQSGCDERDNQDEIARLDFGMIVAIFGFCNA